MSRNYAHREANIDLPQSESPFPTEANQYSDAITSLRYYLRLNPNARDAATVKSLINKLEFKTEQVLTPKDYAEIFISLADKKMWRMVGNCGDLFIAPPELVSENEVRIVYFESPDPYRRASGIDKIEGNEISYGTSFCDTSGLDCYRISSNIVEILSRGRVKVTQHVGYHSYSPRTSRYNSSSCEYIRK